MTQGTAMQQPTAPLFNNRQGQNPFAAQQQRTNAQAAAVVRQPRSFQSYNGQGPATGNGTTPPRIINGMSFPRENPNLLSRTSALVQQGIQA
jgi:hypothetical protein